ncbi:MAG: transcriptional regulator, partial [Betaproteobacteria bacterium]
MDEDQLDLLFHALASQPRREMLDLLRRHPGSNVGFVAAHFELSRIGVMKHLYVMEAANLIVSERSGRE